MPNYRTLATLIALPLGFAAVGVVSAADLTKEELASRLNGISVDDITDAPIPGMYEVAVGANVAYVTKDGRYIIRGDIINVETSANVSEETRSRARATMLHSVDPATMIVFKPNGEVKHTVTIFTDVDCGYCRQFHREIDKVTALGIEVHYLFYPRTGPNTESWAKADEVWCAPDHNAALTRAKLGGSLPAASDACKTPVETHYELGQRIGVRGTPAVFNEAGDLIGGYLPPATLAKVLDDPNALIEE